jgi:hypothetical protein
MTMHPRPLALFGAIGLSALTLGACAPMRVSSYLERGVEFKAYRTFNWDQSDSRATGDPRLDNNPFFHERVQADVEDFLTRRGFEKTTSGTPELLLHYHASIDQRIDVNSADRAYGYCTECEPYVYEAGTLVIDFIDARTNKLVWRGWTEGSVEGVVDNQEWMEEKIDEVVARILEKLPSRL